jgi:predicted ATPase
MSAAVWRLRLLGDFALECEGRQIRRLRAQKYARLLAYFAMRPGVARGREELIELFWPDQPFEAGQACLRTALSSLRRQLGASDLFLDGFRDTLRLNTARMTTDVAEFEDAVNAKEPRARSLYGGQFLPGCYDDWAIEERYRLEALFETVPKKSAFSPPEITPPGKGHSPDRSHLSYPITRFYGRAEEIDSIVSLLNDGRRLVTLVGLGGSGKSRLAIEVARRLAGRVRFVPLSDQTTLEGMATVLCDALPIDRTPAESALARAREAMAQEPTTLVLDNLEQFVSSTSVEWFAQLLSATESVSILATSRIPLAIDGEIVFPVRPLQSSDAVQLFVDRARSVLPDFPDSAVLPDLCDRLDRIPLAIELCASWANVLSSARMLAGRSQRFEIMKSRKRSVANRHQSLHAVLEWTCGADDDLRQNLGMLSVLRGRWTLDAAEAILGDRASAIVDQLSERSLIQSETGHGELRFSMLESVRDFALESLDDDMVEFARELHNLYFCARADVVQKTERNDSPAAFGILERDHPNFVSAFEYGVAAPKDVFERTLVAIEKVRWWWWIRGHLAAILRLYGVMASRIDEGFTGAAQVYIEFAAAEVAQERQDYRRAIVHLERAIVHCAAIGDARLHIKCLRTLGWAHDHLEEYDRAIAIYEAAAAMGLAVDEESYYVSMAHVAELYTKLKDVERAEPIYFELLEFWLPRPGADGHIATMQRALGLCAAIRHDLERARSMLLAAAATFHRLGHTRRELDSWQDLKRTLRELGDEAGAAEAQAECDRLTFELSGEKPP